MPNPFSDWARMYGANKQYLESQGRPSSFLGQIGDIPNRIHEAADASRDRHEDDAAFAADERRRLPRHRHRRRRLARSGRT